VLDLSAEEIRVLGCLVEKQRTTPDQYPLTVNALRLACNQATNRDPVVDYDEAAVKQTAQELGRKGLARFTSGHGSRVAKYRHVMDEKLGLDRGETALLAVLMLRGPQTPGELKGRTDRMHGFADLGAVHETLDRLGERELVARFPRRPGQKEDRYAHRLGGDQETAAADATQPAVTDTSSRADPAAAAPDGLEARVAALEAEVARLKQELGA
jgi:uncharacterized protein YceH (UPF0502 family)